MKEKTMSDDDESVNFMAVDDSETDSIMFVAAGSDDEDDDDDASIVFNEVPDSRHPSFRSQPGSWFFRRKASSRSTSGAAKSSSSTEPSPQPSPRECMQSNNQQPASSVSTSRSDTKTDASYTPQPPGATPSPTPQPQITIEGANNNQPKPKKSVVAKRLEEKPLATKRSMRKASERSGSSTSDHETPSPQLPPQAAPHPSEKPTAVTRSKSDKEAETHQQKKKSPGSPPLPLPGVEHHRRVSSGVSPPALKNTGSYGSGTALLQELQAGEPDVILESEESDQEGPVAAAPHPHQIPASLIAHKPAADMSQTSATTEDVETARYLTEDARRFRVAQERDLAHVRNRLDRERKTGVKNYGVAANRQPSQRPTVAVRTAAAAQSQKNAAEQKKAAAETAATNRPGSGTGLHRTGSYHERAQAAATYAANAPPHPPLSGFAQKSETETMAAEQAVVKRKKKTSAAVSPSRPLKTNPFSHGPSSKGQYLVHSDGPLDFEEVVLRVASERRVMVPDSIFPIRDLSTLYEVEQGSWFHLNGVKLSERQTESFFRGVQRRWVQEQGSSEQSALETFPSPQRSQAGGSRGGVQHRVRKTYTTALREVFELLDIQQRGYLTIRDLPVVLHELGRSRGSETEPTMIEAFTYDVAYPALKASEVFKEVDFSTMSQLVLRYVNSTAKQYEVSGSYTGFRMSAREYLNAAAAS